MTNYDYLVSALQSTSVPFAVEAWERRPTGTYGVIHFEGAAGTLWADAHMAEQAVTGSIDLFSDSADRTHMGTVQAILNGIEGCAWRLESVQYEQDTRLLHWEWVFELLDYEVAQ